MKNVLTGFLTSQDHFGIAPNYMIKGKRKFHTLICQIISLLMNLGCIAMFITLTIELIKRNNPTVNNVTLQLDKGPNATLNSKDLIIAIGILDSSYQVFNDPTVFTFEANYEVTTIYNDEFNNRVTPLHQINCTEINGKAYKENGFENIFISNDLANYHCFNGTDIDDEIVLGGNFGSEFYGMISAYIKKCENGTGIECKSPEEIDKALKGCWFEVFFLDHYIDIYNYTNPIQTYANSFYVYIDPSISKSLWTNFNKLQVETDNGILFDSNKHEYAFKYEKINNDIKLDISNSIIEFGLIMSMSEDIFYRSYIKIQGICANIGGILNGMNIVGLLVLSFFETKLYEIHLINDLFSFHNGSTNFMSINTIKQKNFDEPPLSRPSSTQKRIFGGTFNRSKTKMVFNLSIWEYICYKGNFHNKKTGSIRSETASIVNSLNRILEFSQNVLIQNELNLLRAKIMEGDPNNIGHKEINLHHMDKFKWIIGSRSKQQQPSKKMNYNEDSQNALSSKTPVSRASRDFIYEKKVNVIKFTHNDREISHENV